MDGVYTKELQALASRTFRRSGGKFSDALVALLVSFHIKSLFDKIASKFEPLCEKTFFIWFVSE